MRLAVVAATILLLPLPVGASGQRPVPRSSQPPNAQWREVQSKEVNLRVRIPAPWQTKPATKDGRPCLEAVSPRSTVYFHACSFRDANVELEDLLDQTLDELGVDLDEDAEEESINGLDALVGETTATFDGRDLGMFVVVAGYGDTRYVVYVMTRANLFDANARTMNRIVDSLAPMAGAGR